MLKLPSIDKTPRGEGHWSDGAVPVLVDHRQVIAVEPRQHLYHSYRPAQDYSLVHLSTGVTIEVFARADIVQSSLVAEEERAAAVLTARGTSRRRR